MPDPLPCRWRESAATALLSAAVIAGAHVLAPALVVCLVIAAALGAFDLARREARQPGDPRPIVLSIAALFVFAVIMPPMFSGDIWSYAMLGRILAVHQRSPYLVAAGAFRGDRFLSYVGHRWRTGTTPYGPIFVVESAAVALLAGSHPTVARMAFQSLAALAIAGALLATWRATRSTSALALLGLHPVIATSLINGGHNDALVGVAVLLAVLATRRERYSLAGWLLAAAVLVKFTAGLALLPLVVWAVAHRRFRPAVLLALPSALVAAPLTLAIPGLLHSMLSASAGVITRTSVWNFPLRLLAHRDDPAHPIGPALANVGFAVTAAMVVAVCVIARRQRDPSQGVVASSAAWLVASSYVLPWYTVWALPTSALRSRSRLTVLVAAQGALVTIAYVMPRALFGTDRAVAAVIYLGIPVVLVAGFIWAMVPLLLSPQARGGSRRLVMS